MKKIILMAFAATLFAFGSQAQAQRKFDSTQNVQKRMHHKNVQKQNWQNLNLTEEQKEQMKKNREEFKAQREAVHADASLTAEQKKARMQEIQKASREKTNQLLTAEQKARIKSNNGYRYQGKGKGNFTKKDLNLTDDQKAKMKDMRENMKKEMDGIKNNSTLSQEQKRDQAATIQKKYREQMGQVLTPEQQAKMKDSRGNMRKKSKPKTAN